MCRYRCPGDDDVLFDDYGRPVSNYEKCRCEEKDCVWLGRARFAKCQNRKELHDALEAEINSGFVRNYFKHYLTPVALKTAKTATGSLRVRKKKLSKLIDKQIPKTNEDIAKFINTGKQNDGQKLLMDVPVDVYDFERGLKEGFCKMSCFW